MLLPKHLRPLEGKQGKPELPTQFNCSYLFHFSVNTFFNKQIQAGKDEGLWETIFAPGILGLPGYKSMSRSQKTQMDEGKHFFMTQKQNAGKPPTTRGQAQHEAEKNASVADKTEESISAD